MAVNRTIEIVGVVGKLEEDVGVNVLGPTSYSAGRLNWHRAVILVRHTLRHRSVGSSSVRQATRPSGSEPVSSAADLELASEMITLP